MTNFETIEVIELAIGKLVHVSSQEEAIQVVQEHPDLLGEEADRLLGMSIEHAKAEENEDLIGILENRREFLLAMKAQAGQQGIPQVFQAEIQQANAAQQRYLQGDGISALNEAIAAWERILKHHEFADTDETLRLGVLNDSAVTYLRRYWATGNLEDLDRVLSFWQEAVERTPENSPELHSRLNNLGIGLRDRYTRTGDMKDLENAIGYYEKAVRITPENSPELSSRLNNMGASLYSCYAYTGDMKDLENAIRYYEKAIRITPENSPELPSRLNNMSNGLRDRYARTGVMKDFENAILYYEKAAKRGLDIAVEESIRSSRNWLRTVFDHKLWQEVEKAYSYAVQAGDQVLQLLRAGKETWLKEMQGLPAHAAYALIKQNHLQDAFVSLERGVARLLSEVLAIDRTDLLKLENTDHVNLVKAYQESVAQLNVLTQQFGKEGLTPEENNQLFNDLKLTRQKLDDTIATIRKISGYENFLNPPDADEIKAAVQNNPLVYIMTTTAGGLSLIVSSRYEAETEPCNEAEISVSAVWLPELTENKLREVTSGLEKTWGGYLGAYFQWRRSDDKATRNTWFTQLEKTTHWLWDAVMSPIIEMLSKTCGVSKTPQKVTLIPVGRLNLLPLHAAWTEDNTAPTGKRYALDDLIISYAPNARALLKAFKVLETLKVSDEDSLLAIQEPQPVKANRLPNAEYEIQTVSSTFDHENKQIFKHEHATQKAIKNALNKHTVLHFSCHGMADFNEPLKGGLIMAHDEFLTFKDLMDLKINGARLATLSACEAGITMHNITNRRSIPCQKI